MESILISRDDRSVQGEIELDGSKSISNRVLMIRALCEEPFEIRNISTAKDTATLQNLLASKGDILDAGPAGTTFRFLTSFLCLRPGKQILTGSDRMKLRPIGELVKTLRFLGADINYIERDGYPPLEIGEISGNRSSKVSLKASVSSQFISSLLLIAPLLPNGLEIHLEGEVVSTSYVRMTIAVMRHFGVEVSWTGKVLIVPSAKYTPKTFVVEGDWSGASYFYSIAALSERAEIRMKGLFGNEWQGDSALIQMMKHLSVETQIAEESVIVRRRNSGNKARFFEWDFLDCPDLAQTMAVICAGLGVPSFFGGLRTLAIKETDRIAALRNELEKVDVDFYLVDEKSSACRLRGRAVFYDSPTFRTYDDHRMAMAFAPLAILHPISIEDPEVVAKSYPRFWRDLEKLGFEIC